MLLHVKIGSKDSADGARDCIVVTEAATLSIYGAGIHAGATFNTFKRISELGPAQLTGSAGIHQYQVHLLSGAGFSIMT